MRQFYQIAALLGCVVIGLSNLTGCGDNDREKKDEEKARRKPRLERMVAHQWRIEQLYETVELLEQDNTTQRMRIETMKAQIDMLKEDLEKIQKGFLRPGETSVTLAQLIAQRKADERQEEAEDREDEEKAEKGVLSTLLVLVAAAALVAFFGKMYRDSKRSRFDDDDDNWNPPSPKPSPTSGPSGESTGSSGSTTFTVSPRPSSERQDETGRYEFNSLDEPPAGAGDSEAPGGEGNAPKS